MANPRCGAYRGRTSRQREAIASATDTMRAAFSAEELAAAVRAEGTPVGTATVYRAIAAMADAGFIESVGARGGAAVYARCRASGQHHHLVCTSCGSVAETGCGCGEAMEQAARASGFTVTGHELSLYGLCERCSRKRGR